MYGRSAEFYDAIYSFKNYEKETVRLSSLIQQHKQSLGNNLLDAACGTGGHIKYLKDSYNVEGLDVNQHMLGIAKKKFPVITFHKGDMASFRLNKKFDIITCLFSAVGHLKTKRKLDTAITNMSRHLKQGGVLIVEPWITPENWKGESVHANYVDQPELKIARISISKKRGKLSVMDMHHLFGTPKRVEHFVEHFEMGLFTHEEYLDAFSKAKLETIFDQEGLTGRGLYIGIAV